MGSTSILQLLGDMEIVLCLAGLCFLVFKSQWKEYWALGSFLAVRVVSGGALQLIHHFRHSLGMVHSYEEYFSIYWVSFAVESILGVIILYGVFQTMVGPLKGLRILGKIVICVAVAISIVMSIVSAVAVNPTSLRFISHFMTQLQLAQGVLTLCLLLFVCVAIRPMGLSLRSKVFGVSLGLGIMAAANLLQSMWLLHSPQMRGSFNLLNSMIVCAVMATWVAYFALREPARRGISPDSVFLRWNERTLAWFG